jgi:GH15 family glucan-1,4-alpha-glucosidase
VYKKLEDYGIIGNLDTCALVGRDGSIDWCCFPHIESPSVFAAILDVEKGGHFAVRPIGDFESHPQYIENTNMLQTVFRTSSGAVTLTDFMPMKMGEENGTHQTQAIYRKLTCEEGTVELEISFRPRIDYARAQTVLEPVKNGVMARANNEMLSLKTPVQLKIREDEAVGSCTLKEGDNLWLALHHGHDAPLDLSSCEKAYADTLEYWENWVSTCGSQACGFYGPWHETIVRSSLVLKLLTHHETGAICAAPTTSLPEVIGGVRNWDYRYSWIRDSAFTVQALHNLGHVQDARNFLKWFMGICKEKHEPQDIQIMYGLHGETEMDEQELSHLSGYRGSRPVRIGNGAAKQRQLDIYGELLNAFYETARYGGDIPREDWEYIMKIVDYVCQVWDTRDAGIWEVRGEPRHFVYSKLMCWVALDKGIKIAEGHGFEAPIKRWERSKDEIRTAILQRGFNKKLNSFVQSFDSETLDATSLLIPMMGFLPFEDPRVQGTIDASLEHLMAGNGLVYRYIGEDGLPGKEGTFILCTFWLVNALSLSGRVEEAEEVFNGIMKYISPLGLFSEEIDTETGEQLGNFPQAFSHIGLVNSALYLGRARGIESEGPELMGSD